MPQLEIISTKELLYDNPIVLEPDPCDDPDFCIREYSAVLRDSGQRVGETGIVFWSDGTKTLAFPSLTSGALKSGLGLALYVQAAQVEISHEGHVLTSQYPSESAIRVWESLVRRELAEVVESYTPTYRVTAFPR